MTDHFPTDSSVTVLRALPIDAVITAAGRLVAKEDRKEKKP